MAREATIKVRVDTRTGKKDLRGLEREFQRTTESAARTGASMRLGVGAVAAGAAAGQLAVSGLSKIARSNTKRAVVDTVLDEATLGVMGSNAGSILGALNARDAVAARLGRLAGTPGAISDEMIRREFEFEQRFGAGAIERGKARIRGVVGGDTRDAAIDALVGTAKRIAADLPAMVASAIADELRKRLTLGAFR